MKISSTNPTANFHPKISAYAATAMKMLENFTSTKAHFAPAITSAITGPIALRIRPPQSVPRGWIGS